MTVCDNNCTIGLAYIVKISSLDLVNVSYIY